MKKSYTIDLSASGIKELQKGLKERKKWLEEKGNELARRLAEMGALKASFGFSSVIYTGDEDHEITVEQIGDMAYKVKATGSTVLFVEFGTGLIGYGHPEPQGLGPGTYPGKDHWNDPNGWWLPRDKAGGHSAHTYGNPPNMPMYNSVKELKQELARVVKEVFAE